MKVICIKEPSPGHCSDEFCKMQPDAPPIFIGNEYTVIEMFEFYGLVFYELAEIPRSPQINVYESSFFAQKSDIDETELVNEKLLNI